MGSRVTKNWSKEKDKKKTVNPPERCAFMLKKINLLYELAKPQVSDRAAKALKLEYE